MEVETGIRHILDGESILFIGAGYSLGAINLRNEPFIAGQEIANHFASGAGLQLGTGLEDAAEAFLEKRGVDALIREVQEKFTAKEVASFHRRIAALPWKRVYTTNYDNVFELSARNEGKRITPVTLASNIYQMPKDHLICVHLNGYIENLNRETILTDLKLTDTSYVSTSVVDSEWAYLFRQDIKLSSAVFFVGYSLFDIDIRRLLVATDEDKKKLFFYLGSTPQEVAENRVGRFGTAIRASTEEFATCINKVATNYDPRDTVKQAPTSFQEIVTPSVMTKIKDSAFIDMLLWGKRSCDLVAESLRTGTTYYLYRSQIEDVLNALENGNRIIVITSDLGNGKSMLLEGLRLVAIERGFRVFDIPDSSRDVDKDLESITTSGEKVLITIEEYQNRLDQIRLFSTVACAQANLVLTARNAVHDVIIDELEEIVGPMSILEIHVDTLRDSEIEWIVNALNQYGLWGKYAGLGHSRKIKFIREDCHGQLHAILLKVLKSPEIGQRVRDVTSRIHKKEENYRPLLSIFILVLLNYRPTIDLLIDIWGAEIIGNSKFRSDPVAREIVSFNSNDVVVRSPIIAKHILSNFTETGTLIEVLTIMAEKIEKGKGISALYEDILKSLMRFSSLQIILPEQGRRAAVIKYYESIKNLRSCQSNPLFWLQYAIASLVIEDISRAQFYFETAYSLAAKKNWDTFQIDNHFSRFLMIQAIHDLDFKQAMENFRKTRSIIDRQIRDERRHYPYRVAILFQDFFNRFGEKMNFKEVKEFDQAARRIYQRTDELPEHRRANKYVRECRDAMRYITQVCEEKLRAIKRNEGDIEQEVCS